MMTQLDLSSFSEGRFGHLWIDDATTYDSNKSSVPDALRENLCEFVDQGYTIFRQAVPESTVDQILADRAQLYSDPEKFVTLRMGKYFDPRKIGKMARADRISDLLAVSPAARAAISAPQITAFLRLIFNDDPLAMQSIYFEYGSQQGIHQDTAYVIAKKPLNLAASWIALEDIQQGSGELIYYPGSHRFEHFLFSQEHKHFAVERDGNKQHSEFLQNLHDQAKQRGISKDRFLARKGDVLVWHADLAHGGAKIKNEALTRRSLVAHYLPISVKPRYSDKNDFYHEHKHASGMYFSSRHYDLRPLDSGADQGVVRANGGFKLPEIAPEVAPATSRFGRLKQRLLGS